MGFNKVIFDEMSDSPFRNTTEKKTNSTYLVSKQGKSRWSNIFAVRWIRFGLLSFLQTVIVGKGIFSTG